MAKLLGLFQDPQQVADAMDELKKNEFPPQDLDIYSGSPFPEGTFGEHDPNHRLFMFPLVGALTLGDAERVRGYRSYAVGTRALFGSAELRMPILFDLQTTVLGLARFGPVAPSLFADAGLVWTGADFDNAARRVGVGAEVANLVSLGGFEFRHALGLAIPASRLDEVWNGTLPFDDVDVTYRIQAAVPF